MILTDEFEDLELTRHEIELCWDMIKDNPQIQMVRIPRLRTSLSPLWHDEEKEEDKVNWKELIENGN